MSTETRRYTKVARARTEELTRVALLSAAEAAYLSGSLDRVSLETLAAAAGTTKQTLLRHFGTKDGLMRAAYMRGYEEVREQRLAAPEGDIQGAVDNLLDHYADYGERALKIGAIAGTGLTAEIGATARQLHYDWVEHAFGLWLARTRGPKRDRLRAALIVLCDVQTWAILSRDLGFSRPQVRATLITAIESLTGETKRK